MMIRHHVTVGGDEKAGPLRPLKPLTRTAIWKIPAELVKKVVKWVITRHIRKCKLPAIRNLTTSLGKYTHDCRPYLFSNIGKS